MINKAVKNGSLYFRKVGEKKILYMKFYNASGELRRLSTGTNDMAKANAVLISMQNAALQEKLTGKKELPKTTFLQLVEKYLPKYEKQRDVFTVKALLPYFGDMLINEITAEIVENYCLHRAEKVSACTVEKEFALGRRMFNVARKTWRITGSNSNPFADIEFRKLLPYNNEKNRIVSNEEEAALLAACGDNILMQDIIVFALNTACRFGEVLSVSLKHINLSQRVITMQASKGGRTKTIPISDRLYQMLSRRLQTQIRNINGKLFDISYVSAKEAYRRAVKLSNLQGVCFHTLRHTCISRWCMAGVPDNLILDMVGWQSSVMLRRYAHYRAGCKSMQDAAAALDSFYENEAQTAHTKKVHVFAKC